MKALYSQLLTATFKAEFDLNKPVREMLLANNTSVPVQPKLWSDIMLAGHTRWPVMPPNTRLDIRKVLQTWPGTFVGDCVIFASAVTGSFISASQLKHAVPLAAGEAVDSAGEAQMVVSALPNSERNIVSMNGKFPDFGASWNDLVSPNDIGDPPSPTAQMLIPADSPRICVGIATHQPGQPGSWNVLLHEQYWKRDPSSFSLAPQSTRLVSTSHTSGRVDTSSNEQSVSETLGTSLSVGWGPISASISASLSKTETTSRSVSLSESDSLALQETYENKSEFNEVIIFWNLVDVYTWISTQSAVPTQLAVVELQQAPTLVRRYLQKPSITG